MTLKLLENTYAAFDFAEQYFENRPNSDCWLNATYKQKEKALIFATKKVNNFNFIGEKKLKNQPLEFPRNFLPELPFDIMFATCEEAVAILENSPHSKNKKQGISSIALGNSSVHYFDKNNIGVLISQDAFEYLSKWIEKTFNFG